MGFDTILCALDLTEASAEALARAVEIAEAFGGRVHVVHVLDQPCLRPLEELAVGDQAGLARELEDSARQRFDTLVRTCGIPGERIAAFQVRQGEAVEEISDAAEALGADLIVVRTHGRRGIDRYLQRSVAEQLLQRSGPPVLTLRPAGEEMGETEEEDERDFLAERAR